MHSLKSIKQFTLKWAGLEYLAMKKYCMSFLIMCQTWTSPFLFGRGCSSDVLMSQRSKRIWLAWRRVFPLYDQCTSTSITYPGRREHIYEEIQHDWEGLEWIVAICSPLSDIRRLRLQKKKKTIQFYSHTMTHCQNHEGTEECGRWKVQYGQRVRISWSFRITLHWNNT